MTLVTRPLIFNAAMGALYANIAVGAAVVGLETLPLALFAVAAALHLGFAAVIAAINAGEPEPAAPIVRAYRPPAEDLAARLRWDVRRAAGLPVLTSPVWVVEPYADRAACWGCGLHPDGERNVITGLRLCYWCRELHEVDSTNQRWAVGHIRPSQPGGV